MANGKQVEGPPVSQPGDRQAGMTQSVGEPVSSQIIPGNRLRGAHSYSLRVKQSVVKLAFPSFSCHWTEKYELWADAPGWEPVAGLRPPCALPHQAPLPHGGPSWPLPISHSGCSDLWPNFFFSCLSLPYFCSFCFPRSFSSSFSPFPSRERGSHAFVDHGTLSGTQHNAWHRVGAHSIFAEQTTLSLHLSDFVGQKVQNFAGFSCVKKLPVQWS